MHDAFRCNLCRFFTVRRNLMLDHTSTHKLGVSPMAYEMGHCEPCKAQTFSSAKGMIQYFQVEPVHVHQPGNRLGELG